MARTTFIVKQICEMYQAYLTSGELNAHHHRKKCTHASHTAISGLLSTGSLNHVCRATVMCKDSLASTPSLSQLPCSHLLVQTIASVWFIRSDVNTLTIHRCELNNWTRACQKCKVSIIVCGFIFNIQLLSYNNFLNDKCWFTDLHPQSSIVNGDKQNL